MLCNITGKILDSGSIALDGLLSVIVDSSIGADNGDSVERYEHTFIIVAGVVDVELESSEDDNITYRFRFYPEIAGTDPAEYESAPILDFHALVPELPAYDWAALRIGTGITTASMSTAALRVAREMLENPNLAPIIFQSLGLYKSVSPPISPLNNTLWINPRSELLVYKTADSLWLSAIKSITLNKTGANANETLLAGFDWLSDFNKIKIVEIITRYTANNPISGSDNFTITAGFIPPDTVTPTVLNTVSTVGAVNGVRSIQISPINVVYLNTEFNRFYISLAKSGSPGLLDCEVTINYQLAKNP